MPKNRYVVLNCLILLSISFIWGNSLLSKEQSKAISDAVGNFIGIFIDFPEQNEETVSSSFVIRKMAHITEFCVLEMLIFLRIDKIDKRAKRAMFALGLGTLVAIADETIQIFSNRGASIRDVGIDCIGVLIGVIILLYLSKQWRKNNTI